jgi:hypothetical protein
MKKLFLRNIFFSTLGALLTMIFLLSCKRNIVATYCDVKKVNCNKNLLFIYYSPYNCIACDITLHKIMESEKVKKNYNVYFISDAERKADFDNLETEICKATNLKQVNIIKEYSFYENIVADIKKTNIWKASNPMLIEYNIESNKYNLIHAKTKDFDQFLIN